MPSQALLQQTPIPVLPAGRAQKVEAQSPATMQAAPSPPLVPHLLRTQVTGATHSASVVQDVAQLVPLQLR